MPGTLNLPNAEARIAALENAIASLTTKAENMGAELATAKAALAEVAARPTPDASAAGGVTREAVLAALRNGDAFSFAFPSGGEVTLHPNGDVTFR